MPSRPFCGPDIIGRVNTVDIVADLPHVSATHAVVRNSKAVSQSGQPIVKVMDLSSNGTCLNNVPVGRNLERELREGDVITFTKLADKITEYPRLIFHAAPPSYHLRSALLLALGAAVLGGATVWLASPGRKKPGHRRQ